jgi:hypothetical protein
LTSRPNSQDLGRLTFHRSGSFFLRAVFQVQSILPTAHPHNLIRDNSITRSGKVSILFRSETLAFGPHRNRCERNRIIDSGADDGVGIDVQGQTQAVTLAKNEVRETRKPTARIGIRIGPEARDITLVENEIDGYDVDVSDLRAKKA